MIDRGSENGAYARAFMFPPFAGEVSADGEFRRGFPDPVVGARQPDAGGSAPDASFHGSRDTDA